MISGNVLFERELIKQSSLLDLPMSHHDSKSCLLQRLNQRTSRVATTDFFNTIGPYRLFAPAIDALQKGYSPWMLAASDKLILVQRVMWNSERHP
jgi:hypothetical protein